jgi:rod shape-determining protein MreB
MMEHIIKKTCSTKLPFRFAPTALICVPAGVTNVERRAVIKAAKEAGAGLAMTIEEPYVAALGAGLPISSPGGNMVVDIGGGTTDIAVLSLGGIVLSASLRVAGNKMDEAIQRHIRNAYNLMIGEMSAEEIKIQLGTAYPASQEAKMEVRGRDMIHGLPKTIEVSSVEIREALNEPVRLIAEKLCQVLEDTPPELAADVIERGITLTGGGALLRGLDRYLQDVTQIQVRVADNALNCVAMGTGLAIEDLDAIKHSGALTEL